MKFKKKALITGITGQDGSYLAELLLEKGYEVHGTIRRSSSINTSRIDHIYPDLNLHYADLTDGNSIFKVVNKVNPDEIYNLAAQSHVKVSFAIPEYTGEVDALGTLKVLEAVNGCGLLSHTKIYQASTSELYGNAIESPQNELTPFHPRSPYGVAKLYGYWIIKNYRESYGAYVCSGILFNHESPRRGETFVTRKITRGLKAIADGKQSTLLLGNLDAKRDWGHAKDYVKAMWAMLQQQIPDDYVIATGQQYSVRDFVNSCAPYFNMDIVWKNQGSDEVGIDTISNKVVIKVSPEYFRPSEVDSLLGDSTKARKVLNWEPRYGFQDLVADMCLNEKG
jgi:GDPmannose 4,6-dehydratase